MKINPKNLLLFYQMEFYTDTVSVIVQCVELSLSKYHWSITATLSALYHFALV